MLIFILSLFALVLVVVGITLIFVGYKNMPDAKEIVPKKMYDKVSGDLGTLKEEEEKLKLKMDTLTIELDKTKAELNKMQGTEAEYEELKLKQETYQSQITVFGDKLSSLKSRADLQAQESINAIETLLKEKEALKTEMETVAQNQKNADSSDIDKLNAEKTSLQEQINSYSEKIKQLELELTTAKKESLSKEEISEENDTINALTERNINLAQGLRQITKKIEELEDEILNAKYNTPEDKDTDKIEETNKSLLKREKILQLEVTKSRVQITGLQAICKEFKAQLEQMKGA